MAFLNIIKGTWTIIKFLDPTPDDAFYSNTISKTYCPSLFSTTSGKMALTLTSKSNDVDITLVLNNSSSPFPCPFWLPITMSRERSRGGTCPQRLMGKYDKSIADKLKYKIFFKLFATFCYPLSPNEKKKWCQELCMIEFVVNE